MAFDGYRYDRAERMAFMTTNTYGVPLQLPFDLVTVDGFQFYELRGGAPFLVAADGTFPSQNYTGVTWLPANMRLPRTDGRLPQDQVGVFEYHGI